MSDRAKQEDWTKLAAMAIPKGDIPGQGRAGALRTRLSQDPCLLRLLDPRKNNPRPRGSLLRLCQKHRERRRAAGRPGCPSAACLRWVLFPVKGNTYFMYQGIFDTDFDKYTEARLRYSASRPADMFENLRVSRRIGRQTRPRLSNRARSSMPELP